MLLHRMAVTALAVAALAAGGRLAADEPKAAPAKGQDRLEAMAAKLGLDDKQKEAIKGIHAEFDQKLADAEHQLWVLHHAEREAMSKALTDEQRAKLPGVLKEMRDKEFQEIAAKLGLNDEQKKKLEAVREEHEQKFRDLAAKGNEGRDEFRDLRRVFRESIGKELTDDQRAKLPGLLREEYREWRDPEVRREHLKAVGDALGLTADEKGKIKVIHADYDAATKEPAALLKATREEERQAVEKVLTADQRTKLEELRKARESSEKKPADKE